jgi:hypothetical protein
VVVFRANESEAQAGALPIGLGGQHQSQSLRCPRNRRASADAETRPMHFGVTVHAEPVQTGRWLHKAKHTKRAGHHQHGVHNTPRTLWRLQKGDVLTCLANEAVKATLWFWDPFSPKANPDLWTINAFAAMRVRGCPQFVAASP